MMKAFILILSFFFSFPFLVIAQDNEQRARAAYLNAEEYFNQGKYRDAANSLLRAKGYLGRSNTKIQYLLVKSIYNTRDYIETKKELRTYLNLAQGKESDEGDTYLEMLRLDDRLDTEIEKQANEERQRREQQEAVAREQRKKEATTGDFAFFTYLRGGIRIYVDDIERGIIFETTGQPGCGSKGSLTITLSGGQHVYRAVHVDSLTGLTWSGAINVVNGECRRQQLIYK